MIILQNMFTDTKPALEKQSLLYYNSLKELGDSNGIFL